MALASSGVPPACWADAVGANAMTAADAAAMMNVRSMVSSCRSRDKPGAALQYERALIRLCWIPRHRGGTHVPDADWLECDALHSWNAPERYVENHIMKQLG